jgi:hypothetical protein
MRHIYVTYTLHDVCVEYMLYVFYIFEKEEEEEEEEEEDLFVFNDTIEGPVQTLRERTHV